jgi:hypothetical protein
VDKAKSDSKQVREDSCGVEEVEKQSPPSPSCCSDVLNASALEKDSTTCSLDDCSTQGKSEGDDYSFPDTSCYQDYVGNELTALIKDYLEIAAEQSPPRNRENAAPVVSTLAIPDLAPPPGLQVAMPDLAPPPGLGTVAMPELPPRKVSQNMKHGNKKQRRAKEMVASMSTSGTKSEYTTPEEVKAYQQQMHDEKAMFQMAYAHQAAIYQMAYAQQWCQQYQQWCQQYNQQLQVAQCR